MVNDLRNTAYLPKNWRVMTAAGVATVGLACGLVQPALAELWKGAKTEKSATAVKGSRKTAPAENGFEATIRRLMADSRRTFDQGDHAKAIKLAERAVKISEAAVQVLGLMSECSPEETLRFLADLRARSDASAAALAGQTLPQPSPNQPNAVPVGTSTIAANVPGSAVQPGAVQQPSAAPSAPPQMVAVSPPPVERPPMTATAPRTEAPPIVAQTSPPRTVAAPGWSMVGPSVPATAENSVPPSPAVPSKSAADFLTQSRRAAANGQLDQAIELAEHAVEMSTAPALFGPQTKSSSTTEATRWLDSLVAQRRSTPKHSAERFDPPVKIAANQKRPAAHPPAEIANAREVETLPATHVEEFHEPEPVQSSAMSMAKLESQTLLAKARQMLPEGHLDEARQLAIEAERLKVTYDLFDDRPDLVLADVARAARRGPISAGSPVSNASSLSMFQNDDPPVTANVPTTKNVKITTKNPVKTTNVNTATVSKSAPTTTATAGTADESLWSEELPPVPKPELKKSRPPINFSRSTISREWADNDAIESSPTSTDLRASVKAIPPTEAAAPQEPNEAVSELPIEHSTTQNGDSESRVSMSEPVPVPLPIQFGSKDQADAVSGTSEPVPSLAESVEVSNPAAWKSVPIRPPLRVRSRVQQAVAASENFKSTPSVAESTGAPDPVAPIRLRGDIQQVAAEAPATELKSTELAADFGDRPRVTQSAAASDASPDLDVPVQRFPVQRVVQLRRRLESASSLNPGASRTDTSQSSSDGTRQPTQFPEPEVPQVPAIAPEKPAYQTETTSQAIEASREQSSVTGKRVPVKLRERSRLQAAVSTSNPSSPASGTTQAWMPAVGHSYVTVWKTVDATSTEKAAADDSNLSNAAQPISQARFESSSSSSRDLDKNDVSNSRDSIRLPNDLSGAGEADVAPPPPNEPWFDDETRREHKPSSEVVRKSSFATIDRLAEAFKLPVSTMMTLIGGGGLALIVGGLVAIRAALRRRHSA